VGAAAAIALLSKRSSLNSSSSSLKKLLTKSSRFSSDRLCELSFAGSILTDTPPQLPLALNTPPSPPFPSPWDAHTEIKRNSLTKRAHSGLVRPPALPGVEVSAFSAIADNFRGLALTLQIRGAFQAPMFLFSMDAILRASISPHALPGVEISAVCALAKHLH